MCLSLIQAQVQLNSRASVIDVQVALLGPHIQLAAH